MLNLYARKRGETKWEGYSLGIGGSSCSEAGVAAAAAQRDAEGREGYRVPTGGCGGAALLTQQGPRTQHGQLQGGGAMEPF